MDKPPIIAPEVSPQIESRKRWRLAVVMNFILPGAGQIYLGQKKLGIALCSSFIVCFVGMLLIFLIGYSRYLDMAISGKNMGNDIMHWKWLVGMLVVGVVLLVTSLCTLRSGQDAP